MQWWNFGSSLVDGESKDTAAGELTREQEQARIEHAPNGRLLTYITIADAMVNDCLVLDI